MAVRSHERTSGNRRPRVPQGASQVRHSRLARAAPRLCRAERRWCAGRSERIHRRAFAEQANTEDSSSACRAAQASGRPDWRTPVVCRISRAAPREGEPAEANIASRKSRGHTVRPARPRPNECGPETTLDRAVSQVTVAPRNGGEPTGSVRLVVGRAARCSQERRAAEVECVGVNAAAHRASEPGKLDAPAWKRPSPRGSR